MMLLSFNLEMLYFAGRGMKSGDNFEMLYSLAKKMNAAGIDLNGMTKINSTCIYLHLELIMNYNAFNY